MVWLCGHGSAAARKNGCRYESNPALSYSCFGLFLIFPVFVSLFDISTFPGAGKSGVSFWHWALDASGKDIFSYRDSHKKLTLAGGLRTCPSWCCCCILLSFPLPAVWGDPESRQLIQEQCVQLWDHRYPVYIGVFIFGFFLTFLYCWVSVPNKAVNSGKGLYSSCHVTEILHLSHFCHSFCSAKCSWRKRDERKFSPPICFFFLPVFSSFVFLPPSNVNNAQYLVCLFFPPISLLGVDKADFRSFSYLYGFYIFFLLKKIWFID